MDKLVTKPFERWAHKAGLTDADLLAAIEDLAQGKGAADLGKHLWKLRVARMGGGKRGGFRTVLAYVKDTRAIFLHGFGKNESDTTSPSELVALQLEGKALLSMSQDELGAAIQARILRVLLEERNHGKQDQEGGA